MFKSIAVGTLLGLVIFGLSSLLIGKEHGPYDVMIFCFIGQLLVCKKENE